MPNVIPIGGVTSLDFPADRILEDAKGKMDSLVIMGWDKNEVLYFASSIADGGKVLWLMERCKKLLLQADADL